MKIVIEHLRKSKGTTSTFDLSNLFLYHLNNNDPINYMPNSPDSKEKYMTKISDWMRLFNIKPPEDYFPNNDRNEIFQRASMEHDINFDYGRSQRRPILLNRVRMEPQLFGPNIIFSLGNEIPLSNQFDVKLFPIASSVLSGAGTVERLLESFLDKSHYVSSSNWMKAPLSIHIMSSANLTEQNEQILKTSLINFQKSAFENESAPSHYKISFEMSLSQVTFLFGFNVTSDIESLVYIISKECNHS